MHRNSQKRIYLHSYGYFITTITYKRFPYFKERLLCELLSDSLILSQELREFELLGHTIMPDHIHLLIRPNGKYNISRVIQFIKRHFSRNANLVINGEDDIGQCRLRGGSYELSQQKLKHHDQRVKKYHQQFSRKYGRNQILFPSFKWQKSFRDHIIRDEKDLYNHLKYVQFNWIKHGSKFSVIAAEAEIPDNGSPIKPFGDDNRNQ